MKAFVAGLRAAVIGLAALALPGLASAAPAMWKVSDARSTIYLFGTMHVLQPGVRWRTPLYDRVYDEAKAVWFETDATADPATISALMAKYGRSPEHPLTGRLSPASLAELKPLLDHGRIPIEQVDPLRPWAAAMMLSVAPMVQQGYQMKAGADTAVTVQAKAAAKPIRTFETLEQQIRLFAEMPEPVEVQYLEDVIHEQVAPSNNGIEMQGAWLKGDIGRMGPVLVDSMKRDRPGLYDVLLKRRNLAWVETLDAQMKAPDAGGVQLVNVGALHMIGDDGLPALMAARGYKVERVQ